MWMAILEESALQPAESSDTNGTPREDGVSLHFSKFRASTRTTHTFGMLKTSTSINAEAWARISICLSIKQKGIPNPDEYNKEGTLFSPSELFGGDERIYLALMINRLRQDRLDPAIYLAEMTRAHLNRGAISLKQRVNSLTDIYDLMNEMNIKTQDIVIPGMTSD